MSTRAKYPQQLGNHARSTARILIIELFGHFQGFVIGFNN